MKKIFIAFLVVISVFASSVVSALAIDKVSTVYEIIKWGLTPHEVNSGEDEWVAMRDQTYALWQPYSSISSMARAFLSYDALSNLVSDLNGSGFPCYLEFNRNLQLYVVRGTGPVTGLTGVSVLDRYLTNGQRGLLCCEYNTDSLLSTISSTLTTKLTTLTNGVASIYTKLSSIDDSVVIGTGTLNNIYNHLTGDLTTYLQSIDSSVSGSETFLGQISTKMDSVVNTLTTENGKNSLFYPITRRLDSILSSMGSSSSVNTGSLRYWRVADDSIGSLSVSDIGYDALSSLMDSTIDSYLNYQVMAGTSLYYLDTVDSFSIVHTTVGDVTGYFIQCVGTYRQSVGGVNQFFDGTFYLTEQNNTLFYASDDSRGSTGTFDVSPIVSAIETLNDNVSLISTFSRQGSQNFGLLDQPQQDSYSCIYYFSFPFNVSGFKLVLSSSLPDTSRLVVRLGSYSAILQNSDFTASGSQYIFEHMFSASEFSSAVDPYFVPAVPSDYTRGEGSIILERNDASYNAFGEACNALYSSLRYGDSELYYSSSYTWFSWFIEYTRNFGDFLARKLDFSGVTSRLDAILAQLQTSGGSSSCDHTYSQEMQQSPTCALPGLMVSTCSQCGSSYSEIVSALGHDWKCTDHVEDVTDPETGEVTESGYDIYECSRCEDTYRDYSGDGVPADYGDTSISKVIVKLFSKLGTFAGKILSWIIGLFDKMLSGLDDIITRFSELTAQITGFGGDYPTWLSGFWGILPQELQLALTFAFVCIFIGLIGRKLFFA